MQLRVCARSGADRYSEHGEDAERGEKDMREAHGNAQGEPHAFVVDVILDHDLQPERAVIESRDQQQHEQDRRQRLAKPVHQDAMLRASQANDGRDEP